MKDETDFLWGMYQESTTQGRHHETQKANVTNFIIIVTGGALTFIANKGVTKNQWIIAVFLVILGLFGALFTAKQYERFRYHMKASGNYREALESVLKNNLGSIRKKVKAEHEASFWPLLIQLRLYYFWISFHLLIAVLGILLLIMTLKNTSQQPVRSLLKGVLEITQQASGKIA